MLASNVKITTINNSKKVLSSIHNLNMHTVTTTTIFLIAIIFIITFFVDADAASRVSATNTHRAAMLCCLQHGVTPLMLACRHSAAVAMQLIKAGAVVDQVDTVCSVCVYRPACMSLTLVCCLRMGDRR